MSSPDLLPLELRSDRGTALRFYRAVFGASVFVLTCMFVMAASAGLSPTTVLVSVAYATAVSILWTPMAFLYYRAERSKSWSASEDGIAILSSGSSRLARWDEIERLIPRTHAVELRAADGSTIARLSFVDADRRRALYNLYLAQKGFPAPPHVRPTP